LTIHQAVTDTNPAPQLENIPWWDKTILGGGKTHVWGSKKKINNNSETSGWLNLLGGFVPLALLSCGPAQIRLKIWLKF